LIFSLILSTFKFRISQNGALQIFIMPDLVTINFKKTVISGITILTLCFFSVVSFAQEDMRKVDSEMLKPIDKPNLEIVSPSKETNGQTSIVAKSLNNTSKTIPAKKETGIVGEGKKPESAPSTLNFNIFLYIVDKFKADQK